MAINIDEATIKIKQVGGGKVRVVPMPGQSVLTGKHQIEIDEGGGWHPCVVGVDKTIADSIVSRALNRVICG